MMKPSTAVLCVLAFFMAILTGFVAALFPPYGWVFATFGIGFLSAFIGAGLHERYAHYSGCAMRMWLACLPAVAVGTFVFWIKKYPGDYHGLAALLLLGVVISMTGGILGTQKTPA
jgi:hypothetical protein